MVPVGSCGTFAGVILGSKIYMPNATIHGISISRSSSDIRNRVINLITGCKNILELNVEIKADDINSYEDYFDEYGITTEPSNRAIRLSAQLEGLLLDPIYTGKAMAGLFDLITKGTLNKNIPLIFVHTGGLPIIFSFGEEFSSKAKCIKY